MDFWVELVRDLLVLPEAASTFADPVDGLHFFIIATTMVGTTILAVATAVAIGRNLRRHPGELTRFRRASPLFEGGIIAFILALFLFWWALGYRSYLHMMSPPEGAMDVYVVAKQWMWKFTYPDGKATAGVLVVPEGRPVRLVMTSRDVIHSFYVPAFRVKRDVLPDRYMVAWFQASREGTYLLQCAEFCGFDHSRMRGLVVVLSPEDFTRWSEAAEELGTVAPGVAGTSLEGSLAERGLEVAAAKGCLECHRVAPAEGLPPSIGPAWVGLFGSEIQLEDGGTVVADEAYLTESMMEPLAKVVAGYPPVMPTFQGRLTVAETAALVELIRSLRKGPEDSRFDVVTERKHELVPSGQDEGPGPHPGGRSAEPSPPADADVERERPPPPPEPSPGDDPTGRPP